MIRCPRCARWFNTQALFTRHWQDAHTDSPPVGGEFSFPSYVPDPEPVAWMDDFGNAFPLNANKGAGSWRDDHKRTWKPLYTSPSSPAAPDLLAALRDHEMRDNQNVLPPPPEFDYFDSAHSAKALQAYGQQCYAAGLAAQPYVCEAQPDIEHADMLETIREQQEEIKALREREELAAEALKLAREALEEVVNRLPRGSYAAEVALAAIDKLGDRT